MGEGETENQINHSSNHENGGADSSSSPTNNEEDSSKMIIAPIQVILRYEDSDSEEEAAVEKKMRKKKKKKAAGGGGKKKPDATQILTKTFAQAIRLINEVKEKEKAKYRQEEIRTLALEQKAKREGLKRGAVIIHI